MTGTEVNRIVTATLCGPQRQHWLRQPLSPTDEAAAGTTLVHAASGAPNLLALEAGKSSGSANDVRAEYCHHASVLQIEAEPNQRLLRLRRGEYSERGSYEILAPMGSPGPASNADSAVSAASQAGVSAFIARVLDQLALSAWLPAAFLTAGTTVLLEFRSAKSASITNAVAKLTLHPVPVLVIMIPLLVIATVVTQAFSFEAIRTLEGYWRRRGIASLACRLMTWKHVRRKNAIIEKRRRESAKVFDAALRAAFLRDDDVNGRVVKAVVAELSGRTWEAPRLKGKELQVFADTLRNWRDGADAWRLARIDHLLAEQNCYPVDSRILPTKLGNLIRATEDDLKHAGDDLQSFVLRHRARVPQRVQMQHDQFRTRLDMYCTLVFVSVFLAVITPITLVGRVDITAIAIITGSFAVMAVASYLAAIASAGGYCTALRQMDEAARAPDEK